MQRYSIEQIRGRESSYFLTNKSVRKRYRNESAKYVHGTTPDRIGRPRRPLPAGGDVPEVRTTPGRIGRPRRPLPAGGGVPEVRTTPAGSDIRGDPYRREEMYQKFGQPRQDRTSEATPTGGRRCTRSSDDPRQDRTSEATPTGGRRMYQKFGRPPAGSDIRGDTYWQKTALVTIDVQRQWSSASGHAARAQKKGSQVMQLREARLPRYQTVAG